MTDSSRNFPNFEFLVQLIRVRKYYEKAKTVLTEVRHRDRAKFNELRRRYYQRYWESAAREYGAEIESMGFDYFRIRKGGRWTFVNRSDVMIDDHLTLRIAGNKLLTYRLLEEAGYEAPRYFSYNLSTLSQAAEFLKGLNRPVMVKPARGGGAGRGITKVCNKKQLIAASFRAASISPDLMLEEQIKGGSYRLLYLDGEYIDAIRRDPPAVTGDGKSSIRELIERENAARLSGPEIRALHPITLDLECETYLHENGVNLRTIPALGTPVTLKTIVNENAAEQNHVVRDQVHPSIVKLGRRVLSVFDVKLAGVDLITPDISVPLEECGGVINEINTQPGLHHHDLVAEKDDRVPLAARLLDYLFFRNLNATQHRKSKSGGAPDARCL